MAKAATVQHTPAHPAPELAKEIEDTANKPSSTLIDIERSPNPAVFTQDTSWEDSAGEGFEDVTARDLDLPFIKLLQSGSPEVKRTEPEYIKGAVEGMYLDTVTKTLYRNITVIPCKLVTHFLEWKPPVGSGILIKNHGTDRSVLDACRRDEKTGQMITSAGNNIVETATWFVLLIGGKQVDPTINEDPGTDVELLSTGVLTMASTALKLSHGWATLAQSLRQKRADGTSYQPAMFAMSYIMTATGTRNEKGSWYLPVIKQAGWVKDYKNASQLHKEAKDYSTLAKSLHTMLVRQQQDPVPVEGSSNTYRRDDRRSSPAPERDEDIPF